MIRNQSVSKLILRTDLYLDDLDVQIHLRHAFLDIDRELLVNIMSNVTFVVVPDQIIKFRTRITF